MGSEDSGKYALLDDLAAEFAARYRKGERPPLKEYLDRYPELADEIRELFPAMVQIEQVKEDHGPAAERPPAAGLSPNVNRVGDYRIVREVGRGGMGVVYEAEQVSLGRRVALKVLPLHVSKDGNALARFKREAKAAARLHHTNIVPVFEVGQDGGTCYYAMQFIPGQSLDLVVEELRRVRAESASPLAKNGDREEQAPVRQLAHSLLTGHFRPQDLAAGPATTPEGTAGYAPAADIAGASTARMEISAVLPGQTHLSSAGTNRPHYFRSVAHIGQQVAQALAYANERGIVHRDVKPSNLLLDGSGVVWVTDFGLAKTEDDGLTNPGDLVGTFRYMAPERFHGEGDARADVYSLGLTLYELLTLRPAFDAHDRARLVEQVKSEEPPRPRSLDARIPRDLETIVLKAIDKDPARRYPSAEAMAEDLRRFLADEPVKARRVGLAEHVWRWCRRNRAVATLAAAVLLLVLMVAIGSTAAAVWLRGALHETEMANTDANTRLWESLLAQARANRMTRQPGQRFATLRTIREALKLPLPPGHSLDELRTEAIAALLLPDLEVAKEWDGWPTGSRGFAIDPAFQRYARGDKDGNVSVRRLADDEELFRLPGAGPVPDYGGFQFSPDGRFLCQICQVRPTAAARLWKLDGPRPVLVIETNFHGGFAFRPDSRQCAVGNADGSIRLCDTETGQELRRLPGNLPNPGLQWNPRRSQLLVVSAATWRVVDVDTGEVLLEKRQPGGIEGLDWHPEGRLLAVAHSADGKISLWDTRTGQLVVPPLEGHKGGGVIVRFNHAGDRLFSNDWSGSLRVWDVRTGRQLLARAGGGACPQFSPDDGLVAVELTTPKVRLFRCRPGREFRTLVNPSGAGSGSYKGVSGVAAREGLVAVWASSGVALVDVLRGEEVALLPLPENFPFRFEPADQALWTSGRNGLLRWPIRTDPAAGRTFRIGPPQRLWNTALVRWASSIDGDVMGIPNFDRGALLWQRGTNRILVLSPQDDVRGCAFNPGGQWIATGSHDLRKGAGAKVWDAHSGQHVADLPVEGFCSVGFSPDNKWLMTSGGGVRIWEVGTWREGPALGGSTHNGGFAFSADSKLLALGDAPGVVRLVVPDTGREVARLTAPEPTRLLPQCFTADGTQLITVGDDTRALHLFDLAAIRDQLKELDERLDWDAPALPPAPMPAAEPFQVRVELGEFSKKAKPGK